MPALPAGEGRAEKTETGGITDMIEVKNLTKRYGQNLALNGLLIQYRKMNDMEAEAIIIDEAMGF